MKDLLMKGKMMQKEQPEAIRLAEILQFSITKDIAAELEAAAELRRLHAENESLRAQIGQGEPDGSALQIEASVIQAQKVLSDWNEWYGLNGGNAPLPPSGIVKAQEMLAEVRSLLASAHPAPQAVVVQQEAATAWQSIEAVAAQRYKVGLAHDSMFYRHAVVAGDGSQQIYIGRKTECENMARKFAGAFLDGAYLANLYTHPAPQQIEQGVPDSVLDVLDNFEKKERSPFQAHLAADLVNELRTALLASTHNIGEKK